MNKSKEGDLVEVTRSMYGNIGYRFLVTEFSTRKKSKGSNGNMKVGTYSYLTDVHPRVGDDSSPWAAESSLGLVNPDSDSISEFTFKELIDSIGQGEVV